MGQRLSPQDIARYIDHTLLKPEATEAQITRLCAEAREHGFASVCVNPTYVSLCAELLRGSPVVVCTVIGFPLGAHVTPVKVFETLPGPPGWRFRSRHGHQHRRHQE
jgi:deoxyribose-phosphate aldolase